MCDDWFVVHISTLLFLSWSGIEKLRFKPAFNPYTEPSMEVFSYHEGNYSRNQSTKRVCAENVIIPCCCSIESMRPPSAWPGFDSGLVAICGLSLLDFFSAAIHFSQEIRFSALAKKQNRI